MKNTVTGLCVVLALAFAAVFACGTGSDRGYVPTAVGRPASVAPPSTAVHAESAPAEMMYEPASEADEAVVALAAPAAPPAGLAAGLAADAAFNREQYHAIEEADFRSAREQPLSTFSVDVDTASYSNVRRFLTQGQRPPVDAVRVEELINYFSYERPQAASDGPIALDAEVARSPFDPRRALVRIGVRASAASNDEPPAKRFVFLIDVSGSMSDENKLPLLKRTLGLLVPQLTSSDRVGIVVYAGASGVVLEPTRGHNHDEIMNAIESLQPGGSTNGAAGIELAYQLAHQSCRRGDNCRVLLATDGDFNVGLTDEGSLTRLIQRERDAGIFLTVLGFGMGNLQDGTMELLADKGDGSYAYIDTLAEARKVLVEQASATLRTVAKDTKIQVELNPARVARYRLIGYENRRLNDEDFNDDRKDAGDMGDGHTVTALYELELREGGAQGSGIDPLKYQGSRSATPAASSDEWLTVKVRYKTPGAGGESKLISRVLRGAPAAFAEASTDLRFASAVAGFGMLLRESPHASQLGYADVTRIARGALGADRDGYRREFLELVASAQRTAPDSRYAQ
ncbi:MAG TPA: VWA domain-containing protein [Polyangiales bacterium]|nr:VWA domain-containing protein [Polyangiales bacterium]